MGASSSRKSDEPIITQRSISTSPKKLIDKLHGNLHKNRSSSGSSEKINSDSSTKKHLFKRRLTEDEGIVSSTSSSVKDSPLNHSPMIAAATKVSAKYDLIAGSSSDPCVSQQLANCLLDSKNDDDDQLKPNKIQSNKPLIETTLRKDKILLRQDLLNKWISTYTVSASTQYEPIHDIISDFFLRPSNEFDRRKQKDRQQRLHYLLKFIWKGIYRANLVDPEVIVDWCCGIGMWDMEMAARFPEAQVIGVDFKEATLSNLQHECLNLKFKHVVIHTHSTGLEGFEDNSVDFVMMRDVWFINAPPSKYINVLKESFRILKPGGWIETSEHTLNILSPGPCTIQINSFFNQFFTDVGVETAIAIKLEQFLADTGFVDIDKVSQEVPLGEWAATDELKQTGYLSKDWLERGLRNLSRWVCNKNHIDSKNIGLLITKVMEEELDEYHSYMIWTSYIARKPFNDVMHSPITPTTVDHPPTPPTDDSSICSDHILDHHRV